MRWPSVPPLRPLPFPREVAQAGLVVGRRRRDAPRRMRRRRAVIRAVLLIGLAAAAFAAGIITATAPGRAERRLVTRYVTAWAHGDYAQMYSLLDSASRGHLSLPQLIRAYRNA